MGKSIRKWVAGMLALSMIFGTVGAEWVPILHAASDSSYKAMTSLERDFAGYLYDDMSSQITASAVLKGDADVTTLEHADKYASGGYTSMTDYLYSFNSAGELERDVDYSSHQNKKTGLLYYKKQLSDFELTFQYKHSTRTGVGWNGVYVGMGASAQGKVWANESGNFAMFLQKTEHHAVNGSTTNISSLEAGRVNYAAAIEKYHNDNFFIPLSGSAGYKNYNMTTPFIYQNNGTLYTENGVEAAIDEQLAMNGFWDMTELYDIYSLDTVVASFYNSFRYGEIPVGISGFGTYIELLIAAPELAQEWGISLTPGTVDAEGNINRSQMADLNACMIFDNTDQPDEAWRFMKWWLSEETQTEYALTLQTTYGSEYRWNTANLETFKQLPYDEADKKIILEQWESQVENIRHPANYMMEREISNVWNKTVLDGEGVISAVDEATILINREIERKLKEFGYLDEKGNIVKDYATGALEFLYSQLDNGGATE